MAFQKAVKTKAKLRLGLCGLAGSGKTFSALLIATELAKLFKADGRGNGRIAVIDSERGSASLYADKFDFDVCELDSFSPLAYVDKIREAEQAGYDWIIIDSLTHAWAGKDGALDQKDQAADRGGNSWTAWRNVTPKHNALVDAMLGSKSHVIATLRQKMEYVQETENGKTTIKKLGLAPIQREGMDYEFTLVGDVDLSHSMKIAKTRCHEYIDVGDMFEKPGENFARRIYGWMMNGADSKPTPTAAPAPAPAPCPGSRDPHPHCRPRPARRRHRRRVREVGIPPPVGDDARRTRHRSERRGQAGEGYAAVPARDRGVLDGEGEADERRGAGGARVVITMSSLPRLLNCDGSLVLPRADLHSDYADAGNDEHEELARQVQTGTLPERLARIVPAGSRAEVKIAYDVIARTGRILGEGGGRDYGTLGPFEIPGSIDVLGTIDDTAVIVDWKTGHKEVDPAARNWQLWGYGLAAARALGKSSAQIFIAYTNQPGQPIDDYLIDPMELADFATRLGGLYVREAKLKDSYKSGATPTTREGGWCRHCASKSRCPSKVGLLVQVATKGLAVVGDTALTADRVLAAHLELERLDQLVQEAKSRRTAWIDEHGPIDLGNGKLYGRVPRQGPRALDGDKAVQAIREIVGENAKEFEALAMERKTSQAALKRAAQRFGIPGVSPEKLKDQIVARIDALGGVTRGKDQMPIGEFAKPEDWQEPKALDSSEIDKLLEAAG